MTQLNCIVSLNRVVIRYSSILSLFTKVGLTADTPEVEVDRYGGCRVEAGLDNHQLGTATVVLHKAIRLKSSIK